MRRYYNERGMYGVIVSSGYGAGWSSWNNIPADNGRIIEYLFENNLVKDDIILEITKKDENFINLFSQEGDFYFGGFSGSRIYWLDKYSNFKIIEKDGEEKLEVINDFEWEL